MSLYNWITEKVVLPASDVVLKRSIAGDLKFLSQSQWWSVSELESYQDERLRELVRHAYENVPYYHDLFKRYKLTPEDIRSQKDLPKIPCLTKKNIRENYPHRLVARNIPKNRMLRKASSGSTGEPLRYAVSKSSYGFKLACYLRGWYWMGYRLGDRYVKLSIHPRSNSEKKLQDRINNCVYVHSPYLTEENVNDCLGQIVRSRAKFIRGYPAALDVFARHLEIGAGDSYRPAAISTNGEPLYPAQRKNIEKRFQCPVFDSYSAEGVSVMMECHTHRTYHVAGEYGVTEVLKDGEPIEEGMGEIVGTDLHNYAMPFIRYKVKDIGTVKKKTCTCGRGLPSFERIEGRDTDILVTPGGKHITFYFFAVYFMWNEAVEMFQLHQTEQDRMTLKIVPTALFKSGMAKRIHDDIQRHMGEDVQLEVKLVESIPLTAAGKRRFFLRDPHISMTL